MDKRRNDTGPLPLRRTEDRFSVGDLASLLVDNARTGFLIVVSVVVAASLYVFLATPIYSADALLQVDLPNPNGLGIAPQLQQAPTIQGTLPTDTEMQIIQSRQVLAPVVDKFRLFVSVAPHTVPFLGRITEKFATPGKPLPPMFGLDSYAWGGEQVGIDLLELPPQLEDKPLTLLVTGIDRFRLDDPTGRPLVEGSVGKLAASNGVDLFIDRLAARPGVRFTVVRFNELNAIDRFVRQLRVTELGKATGVVQISYETSDPILAMQATNAIAETYLASHIAHRREEASRMRAFVNGELPQLRDELKRAEAQLSQYKITAGSMQPSAEYAAYLQASIELDRQIATLGVQRAELLNHFVPSTREVRTVDQQIELLKMAKQKFESRFADLPTSERKAADLTRDAKVAEDIYVAMLNKSNELAVTQSGTLGNVHIIDKALRPSTPLKPKRALIILIATVLGTTLAALFILVRRQVSSSVEDPLQAERRLHVQVLGTVLLSTTQSRANRSGPGLLALHSSSKSTRYERMTRASDVLAKLKAPADNSSEVTGLQPDQNQEMKPFVLAIHGPDDLSLEGLRNVRTALQLDISDASNNVLLITGATPGTGKSFVSANLAVLQAGTGKRVLLIDGDLRRGHLASHFGEQRGRGFAEFLAGQIEWQEAVRSVGVNNLAFIPAGEYPSNPSELLSTPRMFSFLQKISLNYDLVIVDTPPVLAVTDANIVAAHAGSTVLVVRPNTQTQREVEETLRRLERAGARVVGIIFNAMPRRRSEKRGYAYVDAYAAAASANHGAS